MPHTLTGTCKFCGKPILKKRNWTDWMHAVPQLFYCYRLGYADGAEHATPKEGS